MNNKNIIATNSFGITYTIASIGLLIPVTIVANIPENNKSKYIGTIPNKCPPQLFNLDGFKYRVISAMFTDPVIKIPTAAVIDPKKGIPNEPPLVILLNKSVPPTAIYLEMR